MEFVRWQAKGTRSPESSETLVRFRRCLRSSFDDLDPRLRDVVRRRYVEGETVRQAALGLGCSPATVVRLERKALAILKQGFVESGYGRDL